MTTPDEFAKILKSDNPADAYMAIIDKDKKNPMVGLLSQEEAKEAIQQREIEEAEEAKERAERDRKNEEYWSIRAYRKELAEKAYNKFMISPRESKWREKTADWLENLSPERRSWLIDYVEDTL